VFNKTDVLSHEFAVNWMKDRDVFDEAVRKETSYMATLTGSMGAVLSEFYNNLRVCFKIMLLV